MSTLMTPPTFLKLDWGATQSSVEESLLARGFTDFHLSMVEGTTAAMLSAKGIWADWNINLYCYFNCSGPDRGLEKTQALFAISDNHPITAGNIMRQVMALLVNKYQRYTWDYTYLMKDVGLLDDDRCYRWCDTENTFGGDILVAMIEGASGPANPHLTLTYRAPTLCQIETSHADADAVMDAARPVLTTMLTPDACIAIQRDEGGEWYLYGISEYIIEEPATLARGVIQLATRGIHFCYKHPSTAKNLLPDAQPLRDDSDPIDLDP
jgi:hypothetical protein